MKDEVLNEAKKELNKNEMEETLKRICAYYSEDKSLIEKFTEYKNIDFLS